MEVPGDAQPEHPAAVLAVIDQRKYRIVGIYIPAAGVEQIRQHGRDLEAVLQEVLLYANISIMDGPGSELREILWRGHEVLRLDLRAVEWPDGETRVAVVGPALVPDVVTFEGTS